MIPEKSLKALKWYGLFCLLSYPLLILAGPSNPAPLDKGMAAKLISDLNSLLQDSYIVKDPSGQALADFNQRHCDPKLVPAAETQYSRLKRAKEIVDTDPDILDYLKADESAVGLYTRARVIEEILEQPENRLSPDRGKLKDQVQKLCQADWGNNLKAFKDGICPHLDLLAPEHESSSRPDGSKKFFSEDDRKRFLILSNLNQLCKSTELASESLRNSLDSMCEEMGPVQAQEIEVRKLYEKSASLGLAASQYHLAKVMMDKHRYYDNMAVDSQKFDEINNLLKKSAEAGNGRAAFALAARTQPHVQEHAHKSLTRAIPAPPLQRTEERQWACRSAELKDPDGADACARAMFGGIGGPADEKEGIKWLRVAAEGGHERACYDLGRRYQFGHGVKRDLAEAKKWYCAAIYFGNQGSFRALGSEEFLPLVGPPSLPEADSSIKKPKHVPTKELLTLVDGWFDPMKPKLDEMEKEQCPRELTEEAKKRSSDWLGGNPHQRKRREGLKALLGKDKEIGKWLLVSKVPEEQYLAGRLLEEKYLTPQDLGMRELFPKQYYEKAAEKGYFSAKLRLITSERWRLALKDRNHESDIAKLRELFKAHPSETGEALGSALSDYVTLMRAQGAPAAGMPDTAEERQIAMCKAAGHGSVTAQYDCGESLLRSGKVAENEAAIKWLSQAAKRGHGLAAARLISYFQKGNKASPEKVKYWQCIADLNGGPSLAAVQYAH